MRATEGFILFFVVLLPDVCEAQTASDDCVVTTIRNNKHLHICFVFVASFRVPFLNQHTTVHDAVWLFVSPARVL